MSDFIVNPRRSPRAPVRCEARVALRDGGFFSGPTTDHSPAGCQLPTPTPIPAGQRVFLELQNGRVEGKFPITGRVAWSSQVEPTRAGIAFDEGSVAVATDFFARLAVAYPDVDPLGRAPERIPAGAALAPAPPPALAARLTSEEVEVLAAVGPGLVASALRDRLGDRWPACVNPLFALLGRRCLVVGPPDADAAAAWAPHLAR